MSRLAEPGRRRYHGRVRRFAAIAALLVAGSAGAGERAFFVFDIPPAPDEFVIKLADPERIAQARRILAGEEPPLQVMGKVVRGRVRYNRPWHVRLAPKSVEFFEVAVEVCDASIAYVDEHRREIGGEFLPGRIWCPWGSRLVREIEP